MNVNELIRERRSTRKYIEKDVTDEVLNDIVELARFAPSWKNTQVVRYHVVKNAELKQVIADECIPDFPFNTKTISRCKALVVQSVVTGVCGYEPDGSFTTPYGDSWEMYDAGIAAQTFCLAAHSMGVGSVILGIFDRDMIAEKIGLPEGERITSLIALGYPEEGVKKAPPRKEVSELLEIIK